MVAPPERRRMLKSRGERSKTLFRKAHQFAHMCDAQVYLVIQYNGMEVKHIYHSHPEGEWPSLNWLQTRTRGYPHEIFTPADMGPVAENQDDDCSNSEDAGDVGGARAGAKETVITSPSSMTRKHPLSPASIRRRSTVRLKAATARKPKAATGSSSSTPGQDQTHANAVGPGPMVWAPGPYGWTHPSIGPWGPGPFPWPSPSTDQHPTAPNFAMWNPASFNGGPLNWGPQTATTKGVNVIRGTDATNTPGPALTELSGPDGMAPSGMHHVADKSSLEPTQGSLCTDGHRVADVSGTTRPLASVARGSPRDLDVQILEPAQESSAIDGTASTSADPEIDAARDDPSREFRCTASQNMHTVVETDVVPGDVACRPPPPAAVGIHTPRPANPPPSYDERQFTPDLRQLATPQTTQKKPQRSEGDTSSRQAAGSINGVHKAADKKHFQSMSRRRLGRIRK